MTESSSDTTMKKVPAPKLNLSCLDGLRCIASLSIILLHVHHFLGALFFPHDEPCMQALINIPLIGKLFFNNSFQMPLFWILSGFLCEYQLDRLVDKKQTQQMTRRDYGRFLLNRWLRLYPIYFTFNVINYIGAINNTRDKGGGKICDSFPKLVESLFFVMRHEPLPATACAGAGWSVMVDVHGYLVLVLLHACISETWRRRLVLPALYTMALGSMAYSTWTLVQERDLVSWKDVQSMLGGAVYSLQYQNSQDLCLTQTLSGVKDIRGLWADRGYEFDTEYWNQMVSLRHDILDQNYFQSVHKNGSSMFLGSWLYLHLKHRRQITSTVSFYMMQATKLIVAFALLQWTSFCWMFSGFPVYLFVDVVVSMYNHNHNNLLSKEAWWNQLSSAVSFLFINPLWKWLAPYTYGIYMSHVLILVLGSVPTTQSRAARMLAGEDVNDTYTLIALLGMVAKAVLVSWMIAFGLYHTVEWPFRYYRTRYTSSAASASTKTAQQPMMALGVAIDAKKVN
ncbi:expressed unknown protein [Seminavis robusta]|uniref:Acyltransferase 3 domain-containing protein n=1 Tax=Seminavis robusta TaxID=568900 RepID=A0A9N8EWF1_9STRA|nr:expressed unknown protein [Seminavis robusta]|eukprot:Sro1756_g295600.1 n/a (510) ;mRNA; r:5201-6730